MEITHEGIGARLAAQIVDWVILSMIYVAIGYGFHGSLTWEITEPKSLTAVTIWTTASFLYFFLLEGFLGATGGKKLVGIKVVMEDGSKCGFKAAFIRNGFRLIDFLPFLYIIGAILIWRSSRKQRLGDWAAGTVVTSAEPALKLWKDI